MTAVLPAVPLDLPLRDGPVLAKHGGDFRRALAARLSETPDA